MSQPDPLESMIADALDSAKVRYLREIEYGNAARLDFYLPDHNIYIEVKRMHSERSSAQLERAENVILVQGVKAVTWLAGMLGMGGSGREAAE